MLLVSRASAFYVCCCYFSSCFFLQKRFLLQAVSGPLNHRGGRYVINHKINKLQNKVLVNNHPLGHSKQQQLDSIPKVVKLCKKPELQAAVSASAKLAMAQSFSSAASRSFQLKAARRPPPAHPIRPSSHGARNPVSGVAAAAHTRTVVMSRPSEGPEGSNFRQSVGIRPHGHQTQPSNATLQNRMSRSSNNNSSSLSLESLRSLIGTSIAPLLANHRGSVRAAASGDPKKQNASCQPQKSGATKSKSVLRYSETQFTRAAVLISRSLSDSQLHCFASMQQPPLLFCHFDLMPSHKHPHLFRYISSGLQMCHSPPRSGFPVRCSSAECPNR